MTTNEDTGRPVDTTASNRQMTHDFWIVLPPGSLRHSEWLDVLGPDAQMQGGSIKVPIVSPIHEQVILPGGSTGYVFYLKISMLSPEQRARVVPFLAEKFSVEPAEIEAELDRDPHHAVPILNVGLNLLVDHPQRWFD